MAENRVRAEDMERLQDAWGDHHRNRMDFLRARNGDHLLIPFECTLCVFRKLTKRNPSAVNPQDVLLQDCITRAILDAFWSRSSGTVTGYSRKATQMVEFSALVGLQGPFTVSAPLPDYDHCGYEVAVEMLLYSRRPGRHSNHMQFDTVRSFRTVFSNFIRSAPQSNTNPWSLGDPSGRYLRFGADPCGSLWFTRFMEGMKSRMGQIWLPNRAMSDDLREEFFKQVQRRIEAQTNVEERHRWIVFQAYAVCVYTVSLRGPEGFLLDLDGLNRHWTEVPRNYVVISLLGRVKGESQDRTHLLPSVHVTDSGINVHAALRMLLDVKGELGFTDGPAISSMAGKIWRARDVDDMIHEILLDIFHSKRFLFPTDIVNPDDVTKHYQCYRTFRRSSDTRAIERQVASADIDVVNRWKKVEGAKGRVPGMSMQQRYAQFDQLLGPFLRYTQAM